MREMCFGGPWKGGKGEHLTYHTFGLTAQLKRKELSGGESGCEEVLVSRALESLFHETQF